MHRPGKLIEPDTRCAGISRLAQPQHLSQCTVEVAVQVCFIHEFATLLYFCLEIDVFFDIQIILIIFLIVGNVLSADRAHNFLERHAHLVQKQISVSFRCMYIQEKRIAQLLRCHTNRCMNIVGRQTLHAQAMDGALRYRQKVLSAEARLNFPFQYVAFIDYLSDLRDRVQARVAPQHIPVLIVRN